jgi:hypothetical protein
MKSAGINGRRQSNIKSSKMRRSRLVELSVSILLMGMAMLVGSIGAVATLVHAIALLPVAASINLVKLTNGTDNNSAPGPFVPVGSTVTFTYVVTNPGTEPLSGVTVRDDNGTPGSLGDDFNATFVGGDGNANGLLDTTETWTFTAARIATPGQYTNVGTATGTGTVSAAMVSDTDTDNHFGASPPNIFGVDAANNLVRFNVAVPGTIISSVPITGLAGGETVLGIDFRPATDQLFALGSTSRLYVIDYKSIPGTAVATAVGNPGAFTLNGTAFGFDFNPTVDRIRVVSEADQNLRLNPNDGTLAATDTNLVYAGGDPNNGQNPNVVGSAYTNSINGATTTTLYGIDTNLDILVTQNPPNAGVLNTQGSLGVNASNVLGFDIHGTTNTAYAAMVVGGTSRLYSINLTTGAATLIGAFGGGTTIHAIAIAPEGFGNTTLAGTTATFNGGTACEAITFDQSGGLLRHNRFSAGDPGFNSDFDFDPMTPGDQTLSATDPAVTVTVNAGGCDDRVTIGSATAPASGLAAAFLINGQAGGDELTINDTANSTARNITINGATSTITGLSGPVTYGTQESLTINAGTGGDTINILGISGAPANVFAGGGDDTVVFGNGAFSDGLIDGGGGQNTLDYTAYNTAINVDLSTTRAIFFAILSGAQEPGPLSTSPASGTGFFELSPDQTRLAFAIVIENIQGATVTGNHFHNAPAGVNGPIVRGLTAAEQNDITPPEEVLLGAWSSTDPPGIGGVPSSGPLTPALVTELLANRIYFNTHTNLFPSGEARGQLINQGAFSRATGTVGVRSFDNVTGGSAGDTLVGNANVNVLRGGPGNDTIIGGPGGDQMFGDGNDDTLVWNNGDGSDLMEGGAGGDTVQVNGSPAGGDQFLIQVNPADPARLRFDRTNLGLFNLNIGTTEALDFNTLGGADTTTVEYAGGNPIPAGISGGPGLDFDGGTDGPDTLILQRSAGSFTAASETYTATGPGAGDITLGGLIRFSNLTPVNDTVPAINFTFTAPAASTALNVVNGPVVGGLNTTQINDFGTGSFELINFANKANVTVNSGAGSQLINVNNPTAAAGLINLTVNGNAGSDTFNVKASTTVTYNINGGAPAVAPGDVLNYDTEGRTVSGDTTPPDGTINSPGVQPVNFTGMEAVNLSDVPISISDVTVTEGDSGSLNAVFTVTLPSATSQTVTVDYATGNGTATTPVDYTAVSGTLTFAPGQTSRTVSVPVNGDTQNEPNETFFVNLSNATNATISDNQGLGTILNDDSPGVQFSSNSYNFSEGAGHGDIIIRRTGDLSQPLTVNYQTSDQSGMTPCQTNNTGFASDRCDYATAAGILSFAAGESEKTIPLILIDDAYVESSEQLEIKLMNPVGGTLGSTNTATISITDNDTQLATTNPIDDLDFFIRQQYIDFLGREPEAAGFAFWKARLTGNCPAGQTCDRIDTSLRFFNSDEFRQRGLFVYLFYHAALGRRPTYSEWVLDVAKLNGFRTAQEQEAARAAFINEFMNKQEFMNIYNGAQTGQTFVDALIQRSGVTPASRQQLIDNYATVGRAATLRAFIETPEVQAAFFDRAFVTMLYFGFLRRDAEQAGFDFWLQKLQQTNHDFRFLINGFLRSDEYRYRFAQISATP